MANGLKAAKSKNPTDAFGGRGNKQPKAGRKPEARHGSRVSAERVATKRRLLGLI